MISFIDKKSVSFIPIQSNKKILFDLGSSDSLDNNLDEPTHILDDKPW